MCTYATTTVPLTGSAKGAAGWQPVTLATVYYDHPVHAPAEHTVNIDLLNPDGGPSSRVGIELDPAAAEALGEAILEMARRARG